MDKTVTALWTAYKCTLWITVWKISSTEKLMGWNSVFLSWNKDFNMNKHWKLSCLYGHFPLSLNIVSDSHRSSGIIFVRPTITPIHVPAVFNVNSALCRRVHSVLKSSSPRTRWGSLSLFQKYDPKTKQSQNNNDSYQYSNQTSSGQSITCQNRT